MKCVLVLSAPRCGSSCMAACIHLCGAYLGKTPTKVKDKFNAKGYFENKKILSFNRSCLNKIGISWDNPSETTLEQNKLMLTEYKVLRQIITKEYDQELCLIKDPRISILWPLYKSVLGDLGMDCPMIVLKRKRASAVKSMIRMQSHLNTEKATRVYDGYCVLIDKMRNDCCAHEASFEDLLSQLDSVMMGICDFLGISYKQHDLVHDFIDEKLVRYK